MLVLSRKTNQNIVIDGRIIVKVVRVIGESVKLGIEAPAEVPVHRQEVYDEIQRSNREAAAHGARPLPRLPKRAVADMAQAKPAIEPAAGTDSPGNPSSTS